HFIVPRFAAGLSAYGGLVSDIRWEEKATFQTLSRNVALDQVNRILAELRERGLRFLERLNVPQERRRIEYALDARYEFQSWEIEVPFDTSDGQLCQADIGQLVADFHAIHERIYTIKLEEDPVEFVIWKVRAVGEVGKRFETREALREPQRG